MKALIGTKIGMTQLLGEDGVATPVTLIKAGPCVVTQLKNHASDGYDAVQIGFGEAKRPSKSLAGHLKKAEATAKTLKEVRLSEPSQAKLGDKIDVSIFAVGDLVNVTGISKGKGFAGTVKRHNFTTGPKTHGSMNYRKPGSIGSMYPQKVFKGKKMAGRMGHQQVTVRNLKIALVDAENNLVAVKGAVPGPRRSQLMLVGGA
ncbi:MAG: 50S ribosomal protein L3 [Candidatus Chaera renei]|uniref:Large ribosomal subunit protein uL3 n=1 Tax=Candidatus Chaera renei TaxID=2506947 RepID=A0A4Q0AKL2_9BACT|nr:MAG: 50S ribosomal protein L3 [Candidatus Chaera renei]